MKIYLDNCSLQRPLDNKTQIRIALEAEAILGVLEMVESGELEIVSSEVLIYEIDKAPRKERKRYAFAIISQAATIVALTDEIETFAEQIEEKGIKPLDALHLASAAVSGVDFFCTCDDSFLKRAKMIAGLTMKVVSSIELVQELKI